MTHKELARFENKYRRKEPRGIPAQSSVPGKRKHSYKILPAAEVLVHASSRRSAQIATNLIVSSLFVLNGEQSCILSDFVALPFMGSDREDLRPDEFEMAQMSRFQICTHRVVDAVRIAAKATRKTSFARAVLKSAFSYEKVSPSIHWLDPSRHPKAFGIERDPWMHVLFGNAITLAYSAIEELGLEIRASNKIPSRLKDGSLNPIVKDEWEGRAKKAGIKVNKTAIWNVRGTPTRIHKKRRAIIKSAKKAPWAGYEVRDIELSVYKAVLEASWLRSGTSAHRQGKESTSLTVYDANNVQSLARLLIMSRFLGVQPS